MALSLARSLLTKMSVGMLLLCARAISNCTAFTPEITMPKVSLSGMTVEALMDLRKRVDETLHQHRAKLQKQLERLGVFGGARVVRGGARPFKGTKIPPKYTTPS